jgi:hypothetical protein
MFDYMLTKEQIKLRDEVRDFIPRIFSGRRDDEISWGVAIRRNGVAGIWIGSVQGWLWKRLVQ